MLGILVDFFAHTVKLDVPEFCAISIAGESSRGLLACFGLGTTGILMDLATSSSAGKDEVHSELPNSPVNPASTEQCPPSSSTVVSDTSKEEVVIAVDPFFGNDEADSGPDEKIPDRPKKLVRRNTKRQKSFASVAPEGFIWRIIEGSSPEFSDDST
ncbi:hypothetical protein GE061_007033 [Apolygus lucorum]|uniref:Uncharacterized protein n=1 Tax=Apolygus lucorum TaxID=248454 RepID=A0A8S9WQ13_APOLU|nr:hypothetical protein GE061_007033 [Apolygus lucorum]